MHPAVAMDVEWLRKAVEKLCRGNEHIVAVVLFGSRARGEAGEYSDVDLFVLTRGLQHLKRPERAVHVYKVLSSLAFPNGLTVVDMDLEEFKKLRRLTSLLLNILWDGVVLYDKTGGLVEKMFTELKRRITSSGLKRVKVGRVYVWDLPKPAKPVKI